MAWLYFHVFGFINAKNQFSKTLSDVVPRNAIKICKQFWNRFRAGNKVLIKQANKQTNLKRIVYLGRWFVLSHFFSYNFFFLRAKSPILWAVIDVLMWLKYCHFSTFFVCLHLKQGIARSGAVVALVIATTIFALEILQQIHWALWGFPTVPKNLN